MNAIEIQSLAFKYPDGKAALEGVSFAIPEGQCVGLIGPNGAGKSTLLWHLNGLLPENMPKASTVSIFGQKLSADSVHEIRREVGLVFQDPDDQIFCPTVYEDVAFGPQQLGLDDAQIRQRVLDALHAVGLAGFEQRMPHHLSGGEKRRVCLAGILACQSRILVLDEPTADLDPRGRRELKALLRQIPATKIIATHDLEMVVELCPRTLILDGGRLVADGDTRELLNNEPLMLAHGLERPHALDHHRPHK